MKILREMLQRILKENKELKRTIRVLEEILRSYLPILTRRKDDI